MSRTTTLGVTFISLGILCIVNSFYQSGQFFGTSVHLTQNSASFFIILGMILYMSYLLSSILVYVFFGQLRALEIEHLYEKSWLALMDMFIAVTVFREDFGIRWIAFMAMTMFIKMFHWILADRVDFMDQSNSLGVGFHIRSLSLMGILWFTDFIGTIYAIDYSFRIGPTMMVLFAFEFFVLMVRLFGIFSKYILHTVDLTSERPWEEKSMYFFYTDLIEDFLKLGAYTVLFIVIINSYGLPIYVIRELYMTVRSFIQRCRDLIQYRRATANMNDRYPTATQEELAATDRVCIVCREELTLNESPEGAADQGVDRNERLNNLPKKLPCGHLFHFRCLKSWLERQQVCPTCRRSVLDAPTPPVPVREEPDRQQQQDIPQINAHPQQEVPNPSSILGSTQGSNDAGSTSSQQIRFGNATIPIQIQQGISLTPIGPVHAVFGNSSPIDVSALSDEELTTLDGKSRQAAIARLEALRKVEAQLATVSQNLENIIRAHPISSNISRKGKTPTYE